MIDWSQEQLFSLLVRSFACGAAMGVYYDILRALRLLCVSDDGERKIAKAFCTIVTFLCDLVFWLTFGLVSIMLIYRISGGVFRGMSYVGMLTGAAVYYFTLGRLTLKIISFAVGILKKALCAVLKLIFFPFRMIFRGVFLCYRLTIGGFVGKIIIRLNELRHRKFKKAPSAEEVDEGGKENDRYVKGKEAYRRDGRISFGYEKR